MHFELGDSKLYLTKADYPFITETKIDCLEWSRSTGYLPISELFFTVFGNSGVSRKSLPYNFHIGNIADVEILKEAKTSSC